MGNSALVYIENSLYQKVQQMRCSYINSTPVRLALVFLFEFLVLPKKVKPCNFEFKSFKL